jgi:hypothetical protein
MVAGLALVPLLSALAGVLGWLTTSRIQSRQAGAQELTATAAAIVAGRKAAVDEMAEIRQHWQGLITTITADNATVRAENAQVKADNATVRAENAQIKADIAALHATHKTDQLGVLAALRECESLNRAVSVRMTEMEQRQAHNGQRLGELEAGHGRGAVGDTTDARAGC